MSTCAKRNCTKRAHVGSNRCFEHETAMPISLMIWAAFCALVSLAVIGVGLWAVIALVQWVTAR